MWIRGTKRLLAVGVVAACLALAGSLRADAGARPPGAAVSPADHAPQGHASEDVAEAVNPLEFKSDLALWTAVVFVLVLAVLWRFAWRPIADSLDKREKRIADDIASAQQDRREAAEQRQQYERKLAAAEQERRTILERARQEAEQEKQAILAQGRAEAQAEYQRKLAEIDQAAATALEEVARRGATLAVELAAKILGSELDASAHARLIEQSVASLGRLTPEDR